MKPSDATRPRSALREFIDSESAGGLVLMAAAALALFVANSPWLAPTSPPFINRWRAWTCCTGSTTV